MMPGPERETANHGGKIFMPASALDKLTRLHITYPMLFELSNGQTDKSTHAGVLEFTAEEGKIYLPFWVYPLLTPFLYLQTTKTYTCLKVMQTLLVEPGDLLRIKSTDLPSGQFIKLQAQSTSFLDISDPKAVLENAFRNFSCLTKGDIFTFAYNDQTYEMAVLETKPETESKAISVLETDLEVDFAAPVGYEEPKRQPSGTSTPRSGTGASLPNGGMLHNQGTMAQAINYASIAPSATSAAAGEKAVSSNFLLGGQRLNAKKSSKAPTPKPSTPVAGASTNTSSAPPASKPIRKTTNGPQPLRLPPGKLFFGYEIKPVRKQGEKQAVDESKPKFQGQGQTLRKGAVKKAPVAEVKEVDVKKEEGGGRTLGGQTLRDTPR